MKRTLLIIALVLILIVGLFALTGCGENKTTESGNGGNGSSTPSATDTSNDLVQATEFYIQNSLPNATTIKEIYATVSGFESWTPNLIAGLELAPGTRAKIGLGLTSTTSSWDFKLVDEEGTAAIFTNTDLSNILAKTAESVDITVVDGDIAAVVK